MSKAIVTYRALEPDDITTLYRWENDVDISEVSYSCIPFSKYILEQYIEQAHLDIQQAGQFRFMLIDTQKQVVGCVDLFDYQAIHSRAGLGILIDKKFRKMGYATAAIQLIKKYAFDTLGLHQLYCSINVDNESSIKLFEMADFKLVGIRKDWRFRKGEFVDVMEFQCLNK